MGQLLDHGPLGRAGVLGLVDQNVIDAAVQSEQHPLRDGWINKQRLGFADQIVEIQRAHCQFAGLIGRHENFGEIVQRAGAVKRVHRPKMCLCVGDTVHPFMHGVSDRRHRFDRFGVVALGKVDRL